MITVAGYTFSLLTGVVVTVATFWLLAILIAAIAPARRGAGIRSVDAIALILTIGFGIAWFTGLLHTPEVKATEKKTTRTASCASITTGDSDQKVRQTLGNPDEIRGEEEVRGAGADVWIYKDSRCAVHTVAGVVVSVE